MQDVPRDIEEGELMKQKIRHDRGFMPVCLDVRGKKCLVVGGGNVALRKIKVLLKFGARVICLSPVFIGPLKRLKQSGKIVGMEGRYPRRGSR